MLCRFHWSILVVLHFLSCNKMAAPMSLKHLHLKLAHTRLHVFLDSRNWFPVKEYLCTPCDLDEVNTYGCEYLSAYNMTTSNLIWYCVHDTHDLGDTNSRPACTVDLTFIVITLVSMYILLNSALHVWLSWSKITHSLQFISAALSIWRYNVPDISRLIAPHWHRHLWPTSFVWAR